MGTDDRNQGSSPGRIAALALELFTRRAQVTEVEGLADGFRRVTLEGDALKNASWAPGDKVQVLLGGWTRRTYTPLSWDGSAGSARLLLYTGGRGPGAAWARSLRAGEHCLLLGPRRSLELEALARPALFAGDETSFGLAAAALATKAGAAGVSLLFEVGAPSAAADALGALGLVGARLVARAPGGSHLSELEALAAERVSASELNAAVLTGNAQSVQLLRRRLAGSLGRSQLRCKAYWAPGKTGLD